MDFDIHDIPEQYELEPNGPTDKNGVWPAVIRLVHGTVLFGNVFVSRFYPSALRRFANTATDETIRAAGSELGRFMTDAKIPREGKEAILKLNK
jgi:hypothetical protein